MVKPPLPIPPGDLIGACNPPGDAAPSLERLVSSTLRAKETKDTSICPGSLKTWTAGEVLDAPRPLRRWVLDGWIPWGKVGMIGATSDHGKTGLVLQLGAAIACACPVFGIPTVSSPAGALVMSFEDDAIEDLGPRLAMVLSEMAPTLAQVDMIRRNLWVSNPDWDHSAQGVAVLLEVGKELGRMKAAGIIPAIVFIETLSSIASGDQNSARDMELVWAAARTLAGRHDVTVAISHHFRKPGGGKSDRPGSVDKMEPDILRGSSANEGAARWIIQMGCPTPNEAEGLGLDSHKALNRGYAVVRASKLKANKPTPFFLERLDPGEPGEHCWVRRGDGEALAAQWLHQGGKRIEDLAIQDVVLLTLFMHRHESEDKQRAAVEAKCFPEAADTKPIRNTLNRLRSAGYILKGKLDITAAGMARAQSLQVPPVSSSLGIGDTSHKEDGMPPGMPPRCLLEDSKKDTTHANQHGFSILDAVPQETPTRQDEEFVT